jgi:hypothetical protein
VFEKPNQDDEPEIVHENTEPTIDSNNNVITPISVKDSSDDHIVEQLEPTTDIMPLETEDTPSTAPLVHESPQVETTSVPLTPPSPKKYRKVILIGSIIAVVLLVVGGGSAFAYTMYQAPQKVITDAIMNAYIAKSTVLTGNVTIDSNGTTAKIDINAKLNGAAGELDAKVSLTSGGKDYSFDASVIEDTTGNLYLRVANIDSLVKDVKVALPTIPSSTIDSLVAKINNVWIKVSADELKTYSESTSKAQSCVNSVSDKFKNDQAAQNEIRNLYEKNQFIVINKELGNKDGSLGYDLTSDSTRAKGFVDGLKTTKIYTALHDCDTTLTLDSSSIDTKQSGTVEVWVSQWSHQLTKVSLKSTNDGTTLTTSIVPTFNQTVSVNAPASSTTLTQLISDITSILKTSSGTNSLF